MAERVVLVFETKEAKDFFMGGLSDGFGENSCILQWDGLFFDADTFRVVPYDQDDKPMGVDWERFLEGEQHTGSGG